MVRNIFLAYANLSFRENPGNIRNVFEEAEKYFSFPEIPLRDELLYIVDLIVELSRFDSPRDAQNNFRSSKLAVTCNVKEQPWHSPPKYWSEGASGFDASAILSKWKMDDNPNISHMWCREVAFAAVYGFVPVEGTCFTGCPHCGVVDFKRKKEILGGHFFDEENHIKCSECAQLVFIHILNEIVSGKEFSAIELLPSFVYLKELSPDEEWHRREGFELPFEHYDGYFRFSLNHVVSVGLIELLRDDRRKLKICSECNRFYATNTIRKSKFCSDKCRLKWHNRKRIRSGEAAAYKRKKRREGAKESYYG